MKLVFLGDFMLGRYVAPFIRELGLPNLLSPIESILRDNLIVTNLESPLTTVVQPKVKDNATFSASPEMALQLSDARISVVSLANNHILILG